ncbi:MAG: glycosyltransferase family 4 protein, partial [Deltaproteobacteria bacterium]
KEKGKVIIHIREPYRKIKFDILHSFFTSQMRKYADRIIAISEDNSKRIGIQERTTVIYNYAAVPNSYPSQSSYTSKKVLYLGGADYIKGFYTLVDALDYLDKDVKVYFGGYFRVDDKPDTLKGRIKQIAKLVLFRKKIAANEKIHTHPNAIVIGLTYKANEYLDEVCCLVSPLSVPHFARPVIEAHLQKKPVIGTDVEGMDEIIEHEKTGLIVPKNNPKALAAAINELTANSQKAKNFGEAGYNVAIKKFTPKNIDEFERVYDTLLSENARF